MICQAIRVFFSKGIDELYGLFDVLRRNGRTNQQQQCILMPRLFFENLQRCFARFLSRLARFWSLAPATAVYSPVVRWATALWTVPLWIALVLGLFRRQLWQWPQVAAPLCVIGLTLVHALYWTDLRMRAPIVPAIALIAAGACLRQAHARILDRYRNAESTAR